MSFWKKLMNKHNQDDLTPLAMGASLGICAGYGLKKFGGILIFTVASGFLASQFAADDTNWEKLKDLVKNDNEMKKYWKQFKKMLDRHPPSPGAIAAGFALGLVM